MSVAVQLYNHGRVCEAASPVNFKVAGLPSRIGEMVIILLFALDGGSLLLPRTVGFEG